MNRRRVLLLAPFGAALVAGAGFWTVLGRMKAGRFDPHEVPSQLIGRPMPEFSLPAQPPGQGFGSADIVALGRPVLVNFFASWCVPCVVEHPELMQLARAGLPIWGIAYKDQVAIDWGVYGVPESYLIDGKGIVRWRMAGPLTPQVVSEQLRPMLQAMA